LVALRLYNTLSRKKEPFQPIDAGNVRMYVCGPTVYDFAHIGNARPVIVFDVLFRLLRHLAAQGEWDGGKGDTKVTYVRNITDVDDKINARAAEEYPDLPLNEAIRRVTEKTEKQFHADVAALGCLAPTAEPRATEHIAAMKEMIDGLVANGCAYVAEDHVLFHVSAMPDYGKLSGRSLDEMIAGARVEVAPYKRDPMDFVLWKPSKPGEPSWPSPAGIVAPGRPGWHIECSAMSWKHLGETFDIHGGGIDLVFPHHENEIAQSRCAFHTPVMAKYWLHNGFLQVEGEKMAKSLGNFVTIHELLQGIGRRPWPGEVIRLTMLATHYRQPLDFNEAKLHFWRQKLSHWVDSFKLFGSQDFDSALYTGNADIKPSNEIVTALSDDLNVHEGLAHLDELARRAIKPDSNAADELGRNLIWLGLVRNAYAAAYEHQLEGGARPDLLRKYADAIADARAIVLNQYSWSSDASERYDSLAAVNERVRDLDPRMSADGVELVVSEHAVVRLEPRRPEAAVNRGGVEDLVALRNAARKAKDFAEADRIRDELAAMGIELKDAKDPKTGELVTTWEVAR
jgi:cysteinyl-tRNA synthetase